MSTLLNVTLSIAAAAVAVPVGLMLRRALDNLHEQRTRR